MQQLIEYWRFRVILVNKFTVKWQCMPWVIKPRIFCVWKLWQMPTDFNNSVFVAFRDDLPKKQPRARLTTPQICNPTVDCTILLYLIQTSAKLFICNKCYQVPALYFVYISVCIFFISSYSYSLRSVLCSSWFDFVSKYWTVMILNNIMQTMFEFEMSVIRGLRSHALSCVRLLSIVIWCVAGVTFSAAVVERLAGSVAKYRADLKNLWGHRHSDKNS